MNNSLRSSNNQSRGLTNGISFPSLRGPNPNSLFSNNIADNFKSNFTNSSINGLLDVLNVSKADLNLFDSLNQNIKNRAQ